MDTSHRQALFPMEGVDLSIRMGKGAWPGVKSDLMFRERLVPVASPSYLASVSRNGSIDWPKVTYLRVSTVEYDWNAWIEGTGAQIEIADDLQFDTTMHRERGRGERDGNSRRPDAAGLSGPADRPAGQSRCEDRRYRYRILAGRSDRPGNPPRHSIVPKLAARRSQAISRGKRAAVTPGSPLSPRGGHAPSRPSCSLPALVLRSIAAQTSTPASTNILRCDASRSRGPRHEPSRPLLRDARTRVSVAEQRSCMRAPQHEGGGRSAFVGSGDESTSTPPGNYSFEPEDTTGDIRLAAMCKRADDERDSISLTRPSLQAGTDCHARLSAGAKGNAPALLASPGMRMAIFGVIAGIACARCPHPERRRAPPWRFSRHRLFYCAAGSVRALRQRCVSGGSGLPTFRAASSSAAFCILKTFDGVSDGSRRSAMATAFRRLFGLDDGKIETVGAFDLSGRLLGLATIAWIRPATAEIALIIRSDLQRRGLGATLLANVVKGARGAGFDAAAGAHRLRKRADAAVGAAVRIRALPEIAPRPSKRSW